MNILLCGAHGFIGRHIHQSLLRAGHTVQAASRQGPVPVDFSRDTTAAAWLPRLAGVDAVVNAVGILRGSARQPMAAIHTDAPSALFDACAQAGVRRVVHISARGIESSATPYATTKSAADAHLLALTESGALRGTVLRPSLVFGPGGASAALFAALSRLPLLYLPRAAMESLVQPLAVTDLADAVAALLTPGDCSVGPGPLALGGPRALSLAQFIATLRAQGGFQPARVLPLPDALSRVSARMGDWVPLSPWCSQTLDLLSTDNVADAAVLPRLIGRAAVAPEHMLALLNASRDANSSQNRVSPAYDKTS